MLTRLRIANFKAFADAQSISLRPLTLVYGPNSAGKSSIMEALLLLKQTLGSKEPIKLQGLEVDLGTYAQLIHRHDVKKPLHCALFWDDGDGEVGIGWHWSWNSLADQVCVTETAYYRETPDVPMFRAVIDQPYAPNPAYCAPKERVSFPAKSTVSSPPVKGSDVVHLADLFAGQTVELQRAPMRGISPEEAATRGAIVDRESWWDPETPQQWIAYHLARPNTPWWGWATTQVDMALAHWNPYVQYLTRWQEWIAQNPETAGRRWAKLRDRFVFLVDFAQPWLHDDDMWTPDSIAQHIEQLTVELSEWIRQLSDPRVEVQAQAWADLFKVVAAGEPLDVDATLPTLPTMPDEGLGIEWRVRDSDSQLDEWPLWGYALVPQLLRLGQFRSRDRLWDASPRGNFAAAWLPPNEFVRSLNARMLDVIRSLRFIGPVRHRPGPLVLAPYLDSETVGAAGENTFNLLCRHPERLTEINRTFDLMGLEYHLAVEPVGDPDLAGSFKLILHDQVLETAVAVDQVGYGISQVLPLLVEILGAGPGVTLMEQPELHVHPRLQAAFGSVLASAIQGAESPQFIIETHSEALLLRLRRLIRLGQLNPDAVSIVYVDKTSAGSQVVPIRLDDQGNFLDPWPDGFFEEGLNELFGGEL